MWYRMMMMIYPGYYSSFTPLTSENNEKMQSNICYTKGNTFANLFLIHTELFFTDILYMTFECITSNQNLNSLLSAHLKCDRFESY